MEDGGVALCSPLPGGFMGVRGCCWGLLNKRCCAHRLLSLLWGAAVIKSGAEAPWERAMWPGLAKGWEASG